MPSLDTYGPAEFVKMILIGTPMSGKTGALTSLVKDGYNLRILDFDAKLTTLIAYVRKECPERLSTIEARTLRDKYKATAAGPLLDGIPKAYPDAIKLLDNWSYEDNGKKIDHGIPATWGKDTILVIDSLTFFARAAYDWANTMVPSGRSGEKDPRAVYRNAQDAIRDNLMLLTSAAFRCNVIITAHIDYEDMPDGTKKGWPTTVGKALGPSIPAMFPAMAMLKTVGSSRKIETVSTTPLIDLANPAPFAMQSSLPIETGLSTFFSTILGRKPGGK